MKLTFLGTRGYIEARTRRHCRHSALMVSYYRSSVVIDWGEDWLDETADVKSQAILITHAHPDHAGGLRNGSPIPVFAIEETWDRLRGFSIEERRDIRLRRPFQIGKIKCEAFPVEHSTRAPAVGYRISAGDVSIFYVPDVVYIPDRQHALSGINLYIGDGATLTRSFVRKPGEKLIGHTPVRTQLTWCQKEGVTQAVITHCGSQIVEGDERAIGADLREMGRKRNVNVEIAFDGMTRILR
jgi:phosphoribosyl 1,2-cyclic phosphodiesterase